MELINYHEEFNKLLRAFGTDAERAADLNIDTLQQLLERYPFSQTLHFIYAASVKKDEEKLQTYLPKASLYAPQRDILYNCIHHPDQFVYLEQATAESESTVDATVVTGSSIEPPEHFFEIENELPIDQEHFDEENTVDAIQEDTFEADIHDYTETITTDSREEETDNTADIWNGRSPDQDNIELLPEPGASEVSYETAGTTDEEFQTTEIDPRTPEPQQAAPAKAEGLEKDRLIGSIAGADFFAFAKSSVDPLQTAAESESVSKYDDDEMPFTFLWWLNKTRKEHAGTYQPYAESAPAPVHKPVADLNHQIIENIFHLQTPFENTGPEQFKTNTQIEPKKKEIHIIERFIKEEPQIKPLQSEKIDTENKARKSAEDANDVVSETLARIYIDQMLYHKAIDTYKKLSLKYPEKSAYFADQIRAVEKKTN